MAVRELNISLVNDQVKIPQDANRDIGGRAASSTTKTTKDWKVKDLDLAADLSRKDRVRKKELLETSAQSTLGNKSIPQWQVLDTT